MIRVSWQINVDYMGADESSWRAVLYLTPDQYEEFRADLKRENEFKGILVTGNKTHRKKMHAKNKKYIIIDSDRFDDLAHYKWDKEVFKKKAKYTRTAEVTSEYQIYNTWDLEYQVDECDVVEVIQHQVEEDL